MSITTLQFQQMLAKPGPKKANIELARELLYGDKTRPEIPSPKPQPALCHEPLAAGQGKAKGAPRVAVRITSFRSRLLDPDNLMGGTKYISDGLRYAGLIRDDTAEAIELTVLQKKCAKIEERTEVVITYPDK